MPEKRKENYVKEVIDKVVQQEKLRREKETFNIEKEINKEKKKKSSEIASKEFTSQEYICAKCDRLSFRTQTDLCKHLLDVHKQAVFSRDPSLAHLSQDGCGKFGACRICNKVLVNAKHELDLHLISKHQMDVEDYLGGVGRDKSKDKDDTDEDYQLDSCNDESDAFEAGDDDDD